MGLEVLEPLYSMHAHIHQTNKPCRVRTRDFLQAQDCNRPVVFRVLFSFRVTVRQCCCQDLFLGLETKTETLTIRSRD